MGVLPHHGLSYSSLRMYLNDLVIKCENDELWALRDGINECIELNLPAVEIELDAKLVVDLMKKADGNLNGSDVIVTDCKEGPKKIPRFKISHCFREVSKCTEALAKRGALLSQDFVIFSSTTLKECVCSSVSVV